MRIGLLCGLYLIFSIWHRSMQMASHGCLLLEAALRQQQISSQASCAASEAVEAMRGRHTANAVAACRCHVLLTSIRNTAGWRRPHIYRASSIGTSCSTPLRPLEQCPIFRLTIHAADLFATLSFLQAPTAAPCCSCQTCCPMHHQQQQTWA